MLAASLSLSLCLCLSPSLSLFSMSALVVGIKGHTFRRITVFYSTSAAVMFSAQLFVVKGEVFTSTREIQLCPRPPTQLARYPLLPANHPRQSIAHALKCKRQERFAFKSDVDPALADGATQQVGTTPAVSPLCPSRQRCESREKLVITSK